MAIDLRGDRGGQFRVEIVLADTGSLVVGQLVGEHLFIFLFVKLGNAVCLDECVGEKTLLGLAEADLEDGKEGAGDADMVAGTTGACVLTLGDDCEGAGYVADGHLFGVLLDFDLLVFDELGTACLQAEATWLN